MGSITVRPGDCVNRSVMGTSSSAPSPGIRGWTGSAGTTDLTLMGSYLRDNTSTAWLEVEVANSVGYRNYSTFALQSGLNIPVNSRVTSLSWQIDFARPTYSVGYGAYYGGAFVMGSSASPTDLQTIGYLEAQTSSTFTSASVVNQITQTRDGGLITQAVLNTLQLGLIMLDTDQSGVRRLRANEAYVSVAFDETPITSNVTPGTSGGALIDTYTPIVTWTYSDDLQPQAGYQVQIIDAGGNIYEDSGNLTGAVTSYQTTRSLTPGSTYTVRVRTRQAWSGPGGDFWSAYAYSPGTFTVTSVAVPDTQVYGTPSTNLGANQVLVQPNINLLSYESAGFEFKFPEWYGTVPANQVITENTSSTYVLQGGTSARIQQANATSVLENGAWIPVQVGTRYNWSMWHKTDAATTVGTMTVIAFVNYYTQSGAWLAYSEGTPVAGDKTNFVKSEVFTTAPANAGWMNVGFYVPGNGASGKVFYADGGQVIALGASDNSYSSPSRGGILRQPYNILTEADAELSGTTLNWVPNSPSVTASISSTVSKGGSTSMRLVRSSSSGGPAKLYLNGTTVTPRDPLSPGYLNVYGAFNLSASFGTVSMGIEWRNAAGTVVQSTDVSLGTVGAGSVWNVAQGVAAGPTNNTISYGVPYINFNNISVGATGYVDTLMFSLRSDNAQIGYQRGKRTFDGPYYVVEALDVPGFPNISQAEFAALSVSSPTLFNQLTTMITNRYTEAKNGYASWQQVSTAPISYTDFEKTFYDRSAKSGTARMYRGYVYAYDNGVLIRSGDNYKTYNPASLVAPSTVSFIGSAWLSSVDSRKDTVTNVLLEDGYDAYRFDFLQYGSKEDFEVEAASVKLSGRKYPVVSFGASETKAVSVTLILLTAADEAAIEKLIKRRTLIIYRDGRGQRIKGLMKSVSYSSDKGGYRTVSFTVQAHGTQFE